MGLALTAVMGLHSVMSVVMRLISMLEVQMTRWVQPQALQAPSPVSHKAACLTGCAAAAQSVQQQLADRAGRAASAARSVERAVAHSEIPEPEAGSTLGP